MKSYLPLRSVCVWLALLVFCFSNQLQAQSHYTPKPGSAERQEICDVLRVYIQTKIAAKKLPKPLVFKIENLRVQGDFAFMQCLPQFKDGTQAVPDHLPDMAYTHCFQRETTGWKVILDLSRSDVPDAAEIRQIRNRLPPAFPHSILSAFWRDLFKNTR